MEFSVFVTEESDQTLEELLKGLRMDATGYAPGIDVIKEGSVRGKYRIEHHRGEITDSAHLIRIINGQIITRDQLGLIRGMLVENKVPYEEYSRVKISKENANSSNPKIRLPKEAGAVYNP